MNLEQTIEQLTTRVRAFVENAVLGSIEYPHTEEARMGWEKYKTTDEAAAAEGDPEWAFMIAFEAGQRYEREAPKLPSGVAPVTPLRDR